MANVLQEVQQLLVPVSVLAYAAFRVRSAKISEPPFYDKARLVPHKALGVSRDLELCVVCISAFA